MNFTGSVFQELRRELFGLGHDGAGHAREPVADVAADALESLPDAPDLLRGAVAPDAVLLQLPNFLLVFLELLLQQEDGLS